MLEKLLLNHYETVSIILIGIGLANLLLQRNLIKKIIGFNIMNSGIFLFLSEPALVIITVSITALALALTLKIYEHYGTLNIDETLAKMTQEQEEIETQIADSEKEVLL